MEPRSPVGRPHPACAQPSRRAGRRGSPTAGRGRAPQGLRAEGSAAEPRARRAARTAASREEKQLTAPSGLRNGLPRAPARSRPPRPAPRLALSCDLETFPLRSRSSAVKACQMAFSSSSLRPTMAGPAADTPLLPPLRLEFSLPVARRRRTRPAPPRGREPGPARPPQAPPRAALRGAGRAPQLGASRPLPAASAEGRGRVSACPPLRPVAEQPRAQNSVSKGG